MQLHNVKCKQRELRESKWRRWQKSKRKLFGKQQVEGRYNSLLELNEKMKALNSKNYQSEIWFENLIKSKEYARQYCFWKNHPVVNTYFVDFWEENLRMAIEIDGSYHDASSIKERDAVKDKIITRYNIKLFRVKYPSGDGLDDVLKHLEHKASKKLCSKIAKTRNKTDCPKLKDALLKAEKSVRKLSWARKDKSQKNLILREQHEKMIQQTLSGLKKL